MTMPQELSRLVRILPEAAFLSDAGGTLLAVNDALAEMSGIATDRLIGDSFESLVSEPAEKAREYLRHCARSRQRMPGAFHWRRADGNCIEMRCDGAQVVGRQEGAPAVLFIQCRPKAGATDRFTLLDRKIAALTKEIVERKRAEQQRDELLRSERQARLEAERVSHMKDEFLATLSHELRTPIHAIVGWTHVLLTRSGGDAANLEAALRTIERNARAQARIVDDLLDMSRIVSGKVQLQMQPVRLAAVIESALDSMRPAAQAKSLQLDVQLAPVSCMVRGDPNRLQQVIWNLLSNAVKFTPRQGRLQVRLEVRDSEARLVVSDSGEGIPPDFLPHVFDRFCQADASTTRRHGGLGLGLAIVRQIVELHGGSVRAESEGPAQGSTFTILLPLLTPHTPSSSTERLPPSPVASRRPAGQGASAVRLRGLHVLVVDDEVDALEMMQVLLESQQVVVSTASSAHEALELLRARRPQLLLCDIGMSGADGCQLLRTVRGWPPERGGDMPAAALSAFARAEDRARALLAGFDAYLVKPVEIDELIATLERLAPRVDPRT